MNGSPLQNIPDLSMWHHQGLWLPRLPQAADTFTEPIGRDLTHGGLPLNSSSLLPRGSPALKAGRHLTSLPPWRALLSLLGIWVPTGYCCCFSEFLRPHHFSEGSLLSPPMNLPRSLEISKKLNFTIIFYFSIKVSSDWRILSNSYWGLFPPGNLFSQLKFLSSLTFSCRLPLFLKVSPLSTFSPPSSLLLRMEEWINEIPNPVCREGWCELSKLCFRFRYLLSF